MWRAVNHAMVPGRLRVASQIETASTCADLGTSKRNDLLPLQQIGAPQQADEAQTLVYLWQAPAEYIYVMEVAVARSALAR